MNAIVLAPSGQDPATLVAVESLLRHDAAVTVVIAHPLAPAEPIPGATVVSARDLDADGVRFADLWVAGGAAFARWAVVPAAIERHGGDGPTLVVPGHAWVLDRLDDVVDSVSPDHIGLLARTDATATTADGWLPEVVVAGANAGAVLAWWAERAATMASSEAPIPHDLWAGFVNGGGSVEALVDPAVRFAPSTIAHIPPDTAPRLVLADGFDPARPWWFADGDQAPQVLVSDDLRLRELLADYAAALLAHPVPPDAWPDDPLGLPLAPGVRREFRRRLATGAPNPFVADEVQAFVDWLRGAGRSDGTGISLVADAVWDARPDLRAAFPHVRWRDRDGFLRWLWTHGPASGLISTALLPELPPAAEATPTTISESVPRFGVNLVGYHDAELGLGVAVRRVGAALDAAGIPWTKVTYDRTNSRTRAASDHSAAAPYRFNLILVAPDQLQFFVDDLGADFLDGHYNIGLWFWETDAMTAEQVRAFDLVDEVWGSTRYLAEVFARHTAKPVRHVPVPLEFTTTERSAEAHARLGLDDRFTFLFSLDFLSIAQRKNPLGVIEAYRRAFEPEDDCRLIIKSINGELHLAQLEELRYAAHGRSDIELWDRYLDAPDRLALVAEADAYVSLHRSEGLGLTMAEAMAAGTPVIATRYSGNLDFMDDDCGLLVDCAEVEIGEGSFYPADGHWAEPDLDQAAGFMRRLHAEPDLRQRLADTGRQRLRRFTSKRVGAAISERLDQLWKP